MSDNYSKLFGCRIYGSIRVNPMALKIINTPEFQRMRDIKQLALCYHVYPAATHTRFEHSIGVYHLVGRMLDKIKYEYPDKTYDIPELGTTILSDKIIECIKIAGLCHDIGHGPFSHVFDSILLRDSKHPNKEHETRSCLITEILCKRELPELDDNHINFIQSIIHPDENHTGVLYQIVANQLNGIDVDKFDYLIRDAKSLGLEVGFDANRLINEFIIDSNNNIAFPKHSSTNIYELFHGRYMMHKKVYSHKTVKLIESMLSDIFIKVDPIFKISESINDMNLFCKLTDETIVHYLQLITYPPSFIRIELSEQEYTAVNEAYKIYQRILSRNLYQQVIEYPGDKKLFLEKFVKHICGKASLLESDFEIYNTKIGFVNTNKLDPFQHIYFYNRKEDNNSFTIDKTSISGLMNDNMREEHTHLLYKKRGMVPFLQNELGEMA